MKIVETNRCKICDEIDYIEHFFFFCKSVKVVWDEIVKIINAKLGKLITIDEEGVMLGYLSIRGFNANDVEFVNKLILIGKMVISKMKYGPKKHYLQILEYELSIRKMRIMHDHYRPISDNHLLFRAM